MNLFRKQVHFLLEILMVEKVAKVRALRETFVEDLAGIGLSIQATHHDLGNFIRKIIRHI